MSEHFAFEVDGEAVASVIYPARGVSRTTLLLGPGTDGSQRNPFVIAQAQALADRGVLVVTYDFPNARRRKNNPRASERVEACCRAALVAARACRPRNRLFVGGKSVGARVAGHVLANGAWEANGTLGLVALGYPLHDVGKHDVHEGHLARLKVPVLFVQGTRDPFGTPDDLRVLGDALPAPVRVLAVDGGDHDLLVPRSRIGQSEINALVADEIVRWMELAGSLTLH
jgi:predicted alpha/beta-hydrolase family hydrolase